MSNFAALVSSLGAVAHWRLGETNSLVAEDAIGSRHALWNAVPTAVDGLVNSDDDGAQVLSAHRAVTTHFDLSDNFTAVAIVNASELPQNGTIFHNGGAGDGWSLAITNANNGGLAAGQWIVIRVNGVILTALTARLIVADCRYLFTVVRRAGIWELWINELLHNSTASYAPITPTTQFTIGDNAVEGENFQGAIDEVAVFPTALSSTSILAVTNTVFMVPPATPVVAVADNSAGGDLLTISTAATPGSFPINGYAVWESTSSDEDSFEFGRLPAESIAVGGTFTSRTAARGKYYAIRAFDDRAEPNYGSPVIVASVAVPVVQSSDAPTTAEILAEFTDSSVFGTSPGGMAANAVDIKAKTDLIGTGSAVVSAPVSGDGDLLELILETDYLAANGRALEWSFDEITGITTSATGKFGLKNALTGTEVYVNSTGTVTDLGSGTFKVSFNITNTALNGLTPGKYDWSVEVLEGSYKITVARNRQIKTRVDIVEKQT